MKITISNMIVKQVQNVDFFFYGMQSMLPLYLFPILPIPLFSNIWLLYVKYNQIVLEL